MKTLYIVNPRAGTVSLRAAVNTERVRQEARGDAASRWVRTRAAGHARELAAQAAVDGYERVVAVGGDGTLNEVAQALVGSEVALGLVPCGSGNGLARHAGIPLEPSDAFALLRGDKWRAVRIDTGRANGHLFVNVMGCGFDAELSRRYNRLKRRGLLRYAAATIEAYLGYRSETYVVEQESTAPFRALIVAVANASQYGNGAAIAPDACYDDGLLDLVSVARPGVLATPAFAARLFLGLLPGTARYRRSCGRGFLIRRKAPGLIHTDGEAHQAAADVEVLVQPASLRLIVPPL